MTEKRFSVTSTILGSGIYDYQAENELCESYDEDAYGEVCKLLNALHEENIQLKSTMKEVAELLEEEVDLFSDKATEHDICAYVELKELDNKDAFYMATSTKKAIKMLKELLE